MIAIKHLWVIASVSALADAFAIAVRVGEVPQRDRIVSMVAVLWFTALVHFIAWVIRK